MSPKRVLIFIDWFFPGFKAGGPISSNVNLIDHFSGEFDFFVITRNTDYCEKTPYSSVVSDTWNTLHDGASVYYISPDRLSFKTLINLAKSLEFDVVFVNGIYSRYFSLFPLIWFKYFQPKKVVVSARGMLSDHTFTSKRFKKKLFYTLARFTGLYKGIIIHATNENEALQIRKNVRFRGEIRIAPNLPPKTKTQGIKPKIKVPGELRMVSIARISPEKNILYALEILEKIAENTPIKPDLPHPRLIFDLFGTVYDPSYWKQCTELIARLPSPVTVNFYGPLEKTKISDTLSAYHFLFMPSQGENYGHAIIESLLAGCPVIISNRTPWRNLDKVADKRQNTPSNENSPVYKTDGTVNNKLPGGIGIGWDLPLEEPARFAEIIGFCTAMDQESYTAMSNRAYQFALEATRNPSVFEANRKLFE